MTRQEELNEAWCKYMGKCSTEIMQALAFALRWCDQHSHWISVEDELPKINPNDSEWEYSDDVIVALKDGSIAVGRYERDNSIGEHYWVLYGVDKDLIVTHWMLVEPPEKLSSLERAEKKWGRIEYGK